MAVLERFYGTGRRKTSVARVWIRPGQGRILVNRRPFEDYFPRETLRMIIAPPQRPVNPRPRTLPRGAWAQVPKRLSWRTDR